MVKRNSAGQDYTNNADGFTLGGGATQRNLSLTGGDVTITGSGSSTYTFPASGDTLVGRNSTDTLKNKDLTDPTNTLPPATEATKLTTARSFQTNLASTSAVNFDGTANNVHGVTGTLPITNGGTGNTSGLAASATKLATARTIGGVNFDGTANINLPGVNTAGNQNTTGSAASLATARSFQTNLASTSAVTFNGTANNVHGVTGTLPVSNGGTGATTLTSGNYLVGNGTSAISSVSSIPVTDIGTGVVKGSNNGTPTTLTLWKGTLSQYNALGTYDNNTVYVIT